MIIYCVITLKLDLKFDYLLLPTSDEILQLLNMMDNLIISRPRPWHLDGLRHRNVLKEEWVRPSGSGFHGFNLQHPVFNWNLSNGQMDKFKYKFKKKQPASSS